MRRLTVIQNVSLDGVMQAPGGPDEDPTGGFAHGGWAVPYFDDVMWQAIADWPRPYELVLGRGTYEIFAAHWPYDDGPIADELNAMRKHVASTTLDRVEWDNATLIEGDVVEHVAALKEQDGPELSVHGSPGLVQTLLAHDLVDELRLSIYPLVLASGKRLFGDGAVPAALALRDVRHSSTGVIIATYARAGEIPRGSFEFDAPTEAELERRRRLGASA